MLWSAIVKWILFIRYYQLWWPAIGRSHRASLKSIGRHSFLLFLAVLFQTAIDFQLSRCDRPIADHHTVNSSELVFGPQFSFLMHKHLTHPHTQRTHKKQNSKAPPKDKKLEDRFGICLKYVFQIYLLRYVWDISPILIQIYLENICLRYIPDISEKSVWVK